MGLNAFKSVSRDGGATWGSVIAFPLPGCHRPVVGLLETGEVLITHRFLQGGQGWVGWWTQNTFVALTDTASLLAESRQQAHVRISLAAQRLRFHRLGPTAGRAHLRGQLLRR